MNCRIKHLVTLTIILSLSGFTHMYNLIGFPEIHLDETHYLRRALQVMDGMPGQDPLYPYDHPYFGQLFLGAILSMTGFPTIFIDDSASAAEIQSEIEVLHVVPRVLMGLLAIIDTFLIYKITQIYYNTNNGKIAGLLAALLFAVMPLSWMTRRVYLDSILLPFLLTSILFAVYYNKKIATAIAKNDTNQKKKSITIILLSGIFLGIAIFTKVPAITMIPLVGSLIFLAGGLGGDTHITTATTTTSSSTTAKHGRFSSFARDFKNKLKDKHKRSLKNLGIWFIPVVSIPLIWPAYAVYAGEFDEWIDGITQQSSRPRSDIAEKVQEIFFMDPILIVLGATAITIAAIRKDFLCLIWVLPYSIFVYLIGHFFIFHFLLILPAFCIASGRMIQFLTDRLAESRKRGVLARIFLSPYTFIITLGVFGLLNTTILISLNVNSVYFESYAALMESLPNSTDEDDRQICVVGPRFLWMYYWLPNYVYDRDIGVRSSHDPGDEFPADEDTFMPGPLRSESSYEGCLQSKKIIFVNGIWGLGRLDVHKLNDAMITIFENAETVGEFKSNVHQTFSKNPYTYESMRINSGLDERLVISVHEMNTLSDTTFWESTPEITASGNNTYILWVANDTAAADTAADSADTNRSGSIYLKSSHNSGRNFGPKFTIAKSIPGLSSSQLAASGDNVYVVWVANDTAAADTADTNRSSSIYLKSSHDSGRSFDPRFTIKKSIRESNNPDIAASDTGLHVALIGEFNDTNYTYMWPLVRTVPVQR